MLNTLEDYGGKMDSKLNNRIYEAFPEFFKHKDNIQVSLMGWGCECSDGWFDIIWELLTSIYLTIDDKDEFELLQIKEKYGTLRVYFDFESNEIKYNLPYKFNQITKYKVQRVFDYVRHLLGIYTKYEIINHNVDTAEILSAHTCEVCGDDGETRWDLGWIKTLCDTHYKEELARTGRG